MKVMFGFCTKGGNREWEAGYLQAALAIGEKNRTKKKTLQTQNRNTQKIKKK